MTESAFRTSQVRTADSPRLISAGSILKVFTCGPRTLTARASVSRSVPFCAVRVKVVSRLGWKRRVPLAGTLPSSLIVTCSAFRTRHVTVTGRFPATRTGVTSNTSMTGRSKRACTVWVFAAARPISERAFRVYFWSRLMPGTVRLPSRGRFRPAAPSSGMLTRVAFCVSQRSVNGCPGRTTVSLPARLKVLMVGGRVSSQISTPSRIRTSGSIHSGTSGRWCSSARACAAGCSPGSPSGRSGNTSTCRSCWLGAPSQRSGTRMRSSSSRDCPAPRGRRAGRSFTRMRPWPCTA